MLYFAYGLGLHMPSEYLIYFKLVIEFFLKSCIENKSGLPDIDLRMLTFLLIFSETFGKLFANVKYFVQSFS